VIRIRRAVTVARPVSVVFDYLVDVRNYSDWQPALERVEQVSEGAPGRGTQWRLTLRGVPGWKEVLGEVVEFDPPHVLVIRSLDGPAEISARATLTDRGDGQTGLALEASIELKGFLRLAEGRVRNVIERELPAVLADLSSRIESE
jgi:uncharacterized protein YndB with AHSA1/START domain